MNKKGIELAASLIVILIISIIVLGLAGGLTYRIFCASGEKVNELDAQTAQLVESKLSSGAKVQVPLSTKEAKSRASFCSGEAPGAAYALGIRNDYTTDTSFYVTCTYKGTEVDGSYVAGASSSCDALVAYPTNDVFVSAKDKLVRTVLVTGPNELGTHVFTLTVCEQSVSTCDASTAYGVANVRYVVS